MNAVFVETHLFTRLVTAEMTDEVYFGLQQRLMREPEAGVAMPGCGGLRKIRVGDPRQGVGTRGGWRVIYLPVPEVKRIFMLTLCSKGAREDLRPEEKRRLREIAAEIKAEALANFRQPKE